AGRGGAAARSRRRSGAAARQADAAPGPSGGGPGGSRPHARDGGAPLRTAHTTARLLEAVAVAAPVARPRAERLGRQPLLEHPLRQLGVRLAARQLHHLSQEELQQLRLAALVARSEEHTSEL